MFHYLVNTFYEEKLFGSLFFVRLLKIKYLRCK